MRKILREKGVVCGNIMKLSQALLSITAILLIGIVIGRISMVYDSGTEKPLSFAALSGMPYERSSPGDHVAEEDIHVFNDKVVLNLEEPFWASFTDTNSMDPIIDSNANSIELKPKSAEDISVGDVISFRSQLVEGTVIHRVIEKGKDDQGDYFITKGDNNPSKDPGRTRFEDINGVVVAIIY